MNTFEVLQGDVNKDGVFDVSDVVAFQKWILAVPDVEIKDRRAADFDNQFDLVKLDGNLTKSLLTNDRTREIISSIVYLLKSLEFRVLTIPIPRGYRVSVQEPQSRNRRGTVLQLSLLNFHVITQNPAYKFVQKAENDWRAAI